MQYADWGFAQGLGFSDEIADFLDCLFDVRTAQVEFFGKGARRDVTAARAALDADAVLLFHLDIAALQGDFQQPHLHQHLVTAAHLENRAGRAIRGDFDLSAGL